MALVPKHILNLSPYKAGKPIEEVQREFGFNNVVKLASNERLFACEIIKSLKKGFEKIISGQKNSEEIINFIRDYLSSFDSIKIEYISIRNPYDFEIINEIKEEFVILIAAFVGEVRLIDNVIFLGKNE